MSSCNHDPAWLAKTDQYRAQATDYLDRMIVRVQESIDDHDGDTTCTFSIIVGQTIDAIDPDSTVRGKAGCSLVSMAEQFAQAAITLAQARQGAK